MLVQAGGSAARRRASFLAQPQIKSAPVARSRPAAPIRDIGPTRLTLRVEQASAIHEYVASIGQRYAPRVWATTAAA